jgi:hypothetical protein
MSLYSEDLFRRVKEGELVTHRTNYEGNRIRSIGFWFKIINDFDLLEIRSIRWLGLFT